MEANDLRKGSIVLYQGELYVCLDYHRGSPGNKRAFVQASIKNIATGKIIDVRFSATHDVELMHLDPKKAQYLYKDGEGFHFMNLDDYHTFALSPEVVDNNQYYLKENMEIEILFHEEKAIQLDLPRQVVLKVVDSPPAVKGDSVSNAIKPAILETGLKISVPLFITEGTMVKIDTKTGEYLGRE